MTRVHASLVMLFACGLCPRDVHAYEVPLQLGLFDSQAIHLRVGERAPGDTNTDYTDGYGFFCTIGLACAGGSPSAGRGGLVNTVSVAVPANQVGNGSPVAMAGNGSAASRRSSYDGRSFCAAGEVYIGGFIRRPGTASPAALTVQANQNLSNGSQTIPISEISWTTGDGNISGGTLSTAPSQIASFPVNRWVEACMSFTYANTEVRAGGTYVARATYTLAQP